MIEFLYSPYAILSLFFLIRIGTYILSDSSKWSNLSGEKFEYMTLSSFSPHGLGIHFYGGFIVTLLGLIQILPFLRESRFIRFHRWLGRVYCLSALITAMGGEMHILMNGTVGGSPMSIAFSVYGIFLGISSVLAYDNARKGNIQQHRRWALRLWTLGMSGIVYRVMYLALLFFTNLRVGGEIPNYIDYMINWLFFLLPLSLCESYLGRVTKCISNIQ